MPGAGYEWQCQLRADRDGDWEETSDQTPPGSRTGNSHPGRQQVQLPGQGGASSESDGGHCGLAEN